MGVINSNDDKVIINSEYVLSINVSWFSKKEKKKKSINVSDVWVM